MKTSAKLRILSAVVGVCCAAMPGGCTRTTVTRPVEPYADASDEAQIDFWHTLPGVTAVSNNEGLHGVLLFADGQDPSGTYEARVASLKDRGWLEPGFDEPESLAMSRGTLAKALCHALEIKGGVMMGLTHKAPRYAVRELVYMEIMAPSTENQVISGLDYIGVISKAQDYSTARQKHEEPAPVPPEEPAIPANPEPN
jgi:hypothetical protein